jgi:predicted ABC-type ATPase
MTKLIVLAPSAGGKSTLMRYLREHSDFNVMEMDEEVMKENNNKWPDDNDYKDKVLVPKIVKKILDEDNVLYLASYVPDELLIKARSKGFKIVLINLSIEELNRRNKERMRVEDYADASPWLQLQLDTFTKLRNKGLVDKVIDGHSSTKDIALSITKYIAV